MTANQPRTGEGIAVLRAATAPGCWRVDGFSGRATGLSAGEVRERMAGQDHDRDLVGACLTAFEAGLLSGLSTRDNT
jgi:hypothetical protein